MFPDIVMIKAESFLLPRFGKSCRLRLPRKIPVVVSWIARRGVAETLACAIAFLAYVPTLGFQFVYDDKPQIIQNPAIHAWRYLPQLLYLPCLGGTLSPRGRRLLSPAVSALVSSEPRDVRG